MWEIWGERNHGVFEGMSFSYSRLKLALFSYLIYWVGSFDMEEDPFVNLLMCILVFVGEI